METVTIAVVVFDGIAGVPHDPGIGGEAGCDANRIVIAKRESVRKRGMKNSRQMVGKSHVFDEVPERK